MTRLIVSAAVVAMFVCSPALAEYPKGWLEATAKVGASKSVEWTTLCKESVFDFSKVDLIHKLVDTSLPKHVAFSDNGLTFKIQLTRAGGDPVVKDFRLPPKHWTSPTNGKISDGGSYGPEYGGHFCQFRTNLTAIFGPLAEGEYTARVWLRTDSFKLDGKRITNEEWIPGPRVRFITAALDESEITRAAAGNVAVDLEIDQWLPYDKPWRWKARIINRGSQPIRIWGFVNNRHIKPSDFLGCPFGYEQFLPGIGWTVGGIGGICGTGMGTVTIPPGKSQNICLRPVSKYSGDGVYRYVVPYTLAGKDGEKAERKHVKTVPFVVRSDGITMLPPPH